MGLRCECGDDLLFHACTVDRAYCPRDGLKEESVSNRRRGACRAAVAVGHRPVMLEAYLSTFYSARLLLCRFHVAPAAHRWLDAARGGGTVPSPQACQPAAPGVLAKRRRAVAQARGCSEDVERSGRCVVQQGLARPRRRSVPADGRSRSKEAAPVSRRPSGAESENTRPKRGRRAGLGTLPGETGSERA